MAASVFVRLRYLRRRYLGMMWRGLLLIVVFGCSLLSIQMGVTFSERPDGTSDLLSQLYYTIGLFVLGGLDLGVPSGGTAFGRALMWFAYFSAPVITAASLIEGVLRAVSPPHWRLRRLRGHIIVVGCGRTGRLYLEQLRKRRPRKPVVVVELRPDHPAAAEVVNVHRAIFLPGDIRDRAIFDVLRLEYADRVLLLTGNDYTNLDAAATIMTRVPRLAKRTVVRVTSLRLLHLVADTRVAKRCSIFNRHKEAASELMHSDLLPHFHRTEGHDVIVLAGFGRFGQTVLDQLQREASDKFDRVIIIDVKAERFAAMFDQQVGFADFYERQVIEGDLRDPRVWHQAQGIDSAEPVFILGSGDEGSNLSTSLWVKSEFPNALVVARNFYPSSFADEVSREGGVMVFSMADLVARSMPERWFGRR